MEAGQHLSLLGGSLLLIFLGLMALRVEITAFAHQYVAVLVVVAIVFLFFALSILLAFLFQRPQENKEGGYEGTGSGSD